MRIFDLTHTFDSDMPVYPGDPKSVLAQTDTLSENGFNGYCLSGGMHVGTHMDAPLHMIEDGDFMSDIAPARFMGRGRLVDARDRDRITADLLKGVPLEPGDIVLMLTGWSAKFREADYYDSFPMVEDGFARILVERRVSLLGLDTPSPDAGPPYSVHKILLSPGILIIENLTRLDQLVGLPEFNVIALPARFRCEAAPVRVIATAS